MGDDVYQPASPRLSPAPDSSITLTDRLAAVTAQRTELTTIRSKSVHWGKGLAGILATILGFGLVKGPTDLSGLDRVNAVAVGIALVIALFAGVVAALYMLRAAYGATTPIKQNRDGTAWTAHAETDASSHALNTSVGLGCASLFALVCAVGLTWYGGDQDEPQVVITLPTGARFCGEPLRVQGGSMELRTNSGTMTLALDDAIGITAVEKCPEP